MTVSILKKALWCLVVCFTAGTLEKALALPGDSLTMAYKQIDSIRRTVDTLKRKTDTAAINVKDISATLKKDIAKPASCNVCIPLPNQDVNLGGWIVVLLPAAFFLFLLLWLMNKGLKDFSLKEALLENTYPTILVDNPQYSSANFVAMASRENLEELLPPTIEKSYLTVTTAIVPGTNPPTTTTTYSPLPPNASISRYIAFITSILTLVVALGVSCFYIYHYVRTGCPPDLTGISTLLLALGIGVMPYIFNKVAGAIRQTKNDSV